jgi:hypothetical protein
MTDHIRRRDPTHKDWHRKARGPSGRGLCRWCLAEVPQGRRTFCGDKCVNDWQVAAGQYRWHVEARDHGLCAGCGLDTEKLERVITGFRRLVHAECEAARSCYGDGSILPDLGSQRWGGSPMHQHRQALLSALGFPPLDPVRSLWDADHITPLAEGGSNHIDNLRTLCVPCHQAETKALRARMAANRRAAKEAAKVAGLLSSPAVASLGHPSQVHDPAKQWSERPDLNRRPPDPQAVSPASRAVPQDHHLSTEIIDSHA